MKFKFGVTTFAASQMRSETIVLPEPNYNSINEVIEESRRKVILGKKILAGFLFLSATMIATKIILRKAKPNHVEITTLF